MHLAVGAESDRHRARHEGRDQIAGGAVKSWLATASFGFALVQLTSALMMYGKLPG
ncbi:DUF6529 family protein, partial [Streptomyces europaeiscabiei]|uniref:DUF6529 family protein n=1 Tax=Streptomyces europaeiscabiei TaxID=146819 RepID=UPI0029BF6EE2